MAGSRALVGSGIRKVPRTVTVSYSARSSTGDDLHHSALAKTIGYTCGAAAKSVLLGTIAIKGVHIPVSKDIYDPLLNELEDLGIAFHIEDHKMRAEVVASEA